MTSAASNRGAAEDPIDPSWWAPALVDGNGLSRGTECPEVLSLDLARLRAEAQVDAGEDSLRTRVLDVLAKAASPMLVPDNWTEPYAPAMQIGNRRSVVPDDLSEPELEMLARLVPLIEEPVLKARVADIAWAYGDRRYRPRRAQLAAYRAASSVMPRGCCSARPAVRRLLATGRTRRDRGVPWCGLTHPPRRTKLATGAGSSSCGLSSQPGRTAARRVPDARGKRW